MQAPARLIREINRLLLLPGAGGRGSLKPPLIRLDDDELVPNDVHRRLVYWLALDNKQQIRGGRVGG